MVLVDKKILSLGLVMVAVGISITIYFDTIIPVGTTGMTEEETLDLLMLQQENQDMKTLSGIVSGIGFLLVLISFGARRKRKSGAKKVEKKPDV